MVKPLYVLFLEWEKTEKIYFNWIKNHLKATKNNIKICPEGIWWLGLLKIATKKISWVRESMRDTEKNLHVRLVLDRDGITQNDLDKLKAWAKKENINLAFSNISFEVRLLLHFKYFTGIGTVSDHKKSLSKEMKKKYEKNTYSFDDFLDRIPKAIEHAKKLERLHKKEGVKDLIKIGCESYTSVHNLVSELF